MKNIINKIGVFALACLAFTSCESEDDNTGDSLINYSPATVTLSSSSPTMFDESAIDADDASTFQIEVTATLSAAQPTDAVIDLIQSGGSASSSDFEAHTITIPAGSTTGSATVDILQTGDIEGSETLQITGESRANFNVSPFTFSATIDNDYINDHLDLVLSWDGSAVNDDVTISSFCEMDYDLVLLAEDFSPLAYIAGTASCPEEDYISGLADGTYYIASDLYSNPYSGLGYTDVIPVTISYSQEHFDVSGSFSSSEESQQNLSSPDSGAVGGFGEGLGAVVIKLVVTNGYEYTLTNFY
ncbi:hypothetical protein [Algibacter sp. R77976]|uniref:hypothetical protein n=1 Tax=Algibacter sp. R77976 TaxID=3093873 RepID=UPI0037C5AC00